MDVTFTIPFNSPLFIGVSIVLGVFLYLLIGTFVSVLFIKYGGLPSTGTPEKMRGFTLIWPFIFVCAVVYFSFIGVMYPFVVIQHWILGPREKD